MRGDAAPRPGAGGEQEQVCGRESCAQGALPAGGGAKGGGGGGGEVVVAVPGEGRGGRDLDSVGEVRYEVGLVFICQGMGLQCVFFI